MEMFRPTRDGGVSGWLAADEARLLRALVSPVMELLDEGRKPGTRPGKPPGAPRRSGPPGPPGEAAVIDELERMFGDGEALDDAVPEAPGDPVLARLLPDAYTGDPKAAGEFRRYTESSLREAKKYFAQVMLDTLPADGGRISLTADQARDWMRALNDVRLMFGVRLEVTEDFEEQLAGLDPDDPAIPAFEIYGWLGAVQESLVQALAR